jgi:mannose-1-phosphate guanylyltransferase
MFIKSQTLVSIMVGGSGTRLWPLSRESFPKQFIDLDNSGLTIFQKTILRGREISDNLLLIANFNHRFIILEQLRAIYLDDEVGKKINIILEPIGKNTLAVAIIAALFAKKNGFDRVLLMPSDQIIQNNEIFLTAFHDVNKFFDDKKSGILTFGITPTFPHTGYGYIEKSDNSNQNEIFYAKKFTEKPNKEIAQVYFNNKTHLWNSGIFFFCHEFFLQKVAEFESENLTIVSNAFDKSEKKHEFLILNEAIFQEARSDSIDFAIMQKLDEICCIELANSGWSDLGSFDQIYDLLEKDNDGNIIDDLIYSESIKNCHIINKSEKPIILNEVEDLLIIAMKDIITITKKGVDGNKIMFDKLKSNSFSWIKNQVFDKRPWGDYENILEKENFKIKIITVKPNSELSYQIHKQRSEHWIVISGIGIVILDDKQITLLENESIYIPQHSKHKIINKNNTQDLIFVEIQCGSYFGEDDIIRINDKYSRN